MRHEAAKRTAERERVREQARIRAQRKTDEELGLSPEDYIKMLRQKVAKQHTSGAGSSMKRHGILRSLSEPGEELKKEVCHSGSSIEDEPPPHGSAECLSSAALAVSRLSPSPVESCFTHYQQLQSSPSEGTSGAASPSSAPLSKVIEEFQFGICYHMVYYHVQESLYGFQAGSCWSLNLKAQIQSQDSDRICGGQSGTGIGFFSE
jgi:hypothetical protein